MYVLLPHAAHLRAHVTCDFLTQGSHTSGVENRGAATAGAARRKSEITAQLGAVDPDRAFLTPHGAADVLASIRAREVSLRIESGGAPLPDTVVVGLLPSRGSGQGATRGSGQEATRLQASLTPSTLTTPAGARSGRAAEVQGERRWIEQKSAGATRPRLAAAGAVAAAPSRFSSRARRLRAALPSQLHACRPRRRSHTPSARPDAHPTARGAGAPAAAHAHRRRQP